MARFAPLVPEGGAVLDLAAGGGRHTRLFLERGHPVTAVDLDTRRLDELVGTPGLQVLRADLETEPWPLAGAVFAGVVVTNYLSRPLLRDIAAAVAPEGVLIYETFAQGHERFGKPSNPDYLLRPGELYEVFSAELSIVAFEQGEVSSPRPAVVQHVCAVRTAPGPMVTRTVSDTIFRE